MRRKRTPKTDATRKPKTFSGCFLSLFGLPFLVAGVFMAFLYFNGYARWLQARHWVETPCTIEAAKLETRSGSDSTTFEATATYRYTWEEASYTGHRVALSNGADNIGSFHQDAYRELSRHHASKQPFRCYVNPANPYEAVLYRDMRWEMQAFMAVFALTFPVVGIGLVIGGLLYARDQRRRTRLQQAHPDEPWRYEYAWHEGVIRQNLLRADLIAGSYTLWSALVIAPLLWAALESGAFRQHSGWLVTIYPALWLIPASITLHFLRRRLATGRVCFVPQAVPMPPGSMLAGHFLLGKTIGFRCSPQAELTCERLITRRDSDGTSTSTEALWTHRESLDAARIQRDISGFRLPVEIAIPHDAPPATPSSGDAIRHRWRLTLRAPGTPMHAAFDLPVFHTEASRHSTTAVADASSLASSFLDHAAANLTDTLAASGIRVALNADGTPSSIICPPARHRGAMFFLLFFNIIWTGFAVFLIKQQAPLLFRIVWPVSAAFIWVCIVNMALHSRHVRLSPDQLDILNCYGPIRRARTLSRVTLAEFFHNSNMRSGNTTYYRVIALGKDNRQNVVADGIKGATTAAALTRSLEQWRIKGQEKTETS